jgi:CRP/FNR family cyclic AMP-dependent transcriptional regulator
MLPNSSNFERYHSILSQSPLFKGCDLEFLRDKLLHLQPEQFQRKAIVLAAPEATRKFFIIVEGRVKLVSRASTDEREITLFLMGPGDAFDVVTLLDQQAHDLSAESLDKVTLLSAPTEQVRDWIDNHPEFNRTFLPYLGRKMSLLSELAADLTLHDTGVRLARLILRHVDPDSSKHEVRLINDLSHEEIAHMIGTVRVVANRQIQNLKRQGIIDAQRGHLIVKDLEALITQCDLTVPPNEKSEE